jgi:hypothetical protein
MHWKDFDSPGRLNLQIGQVADGYRSVGPMVFHGHSGHGTVTDRQGLPKGGSMSFS